MSTMPVETLRATAERKRVQAAYEKQQSRRMLVALFLLLAAIAVVAYRDRGSLFGSNEAEQRAAVQTPVVPSAEPSAANTITPTAPAVTEKSAPAPTSSVANAPVVPAETSSSLPATSSTSSMPGATAPVAPRRAATVRSKPAAAAPSKAVKPHTADSAAAVTTAAADRMPLTGPDAYPLLEQRTRVEGSVVLRALIGTDGRIEDLRVLRGPAVLGSAAREAVSQWKFKPFTQNGSAVETYATITVNFTIRVADGSTKTVASLAPENVIQLADDYQR